MGAADSLVKIFLLPFLAILWVVWKGPYLAWTRLYPWLKATSFQQDSTADSRRSPRILSRSDGRCHATLRSYGEIANQVFARARSMVLAVVNHLPTKNSGRCEATDCAGELTPTIECSGVA